MTMKLHLQIFIAIIAGILIGRLTGTTGEIFGIILFDIYNFIASIFINALTMLIVPVVVSSIITGVAGVKSSTDLGMLGVKTIGYYLVTSCIAIVVGLIFVNILKPGIVDGQPVGHLLGLSQNSALIIESIESRSSTEIFKVFHEMVPSNIVDAAAKGQMLGLIFFSLLFGYYMMQIPTNVAYAMKSLWFGIFHTMINITFFVMRFAPIGVFALVARTVAQTGFGAFPPLMIYIMTVILASAVHVFVVLFFILKYVARTSPIEYTKKMLPALLTAFSTSSSSATLPISMECVQTETKVPNEISSLVLPLGSTINMDGTALFDCVAAIFIAQAYGIELSFVMQFTILTVALITSVGVAGIPSTGLVSIGIILTSVGLPLEGIGVLLITDRFFDMIRTTLNVFGDLVGAITISKIHKIAIREDHLDE